MPKAKPASELKPWEPKSKARDLAAEFLEVPYGIRNPNHDENGKFAKGNPAVGAGRKKGGNNNAVKAIKDFMVELLDDERYRAGLVKRIKSGDLPQIELFLLTKALGKPKEEIEITTNVPLFALPASFVLQEDVVEAEDVKLIEEGGENGADTLRE